MNLQERLKVTKKAKQIMQIGNLVRYNNPTRTFGSNSEDFWIYKNFGGSDLELSVTLRPGDLFMACEGIWTGEHWKGKILVRDCLYEVMFAAVALVAHFEALS